MSSRCKSCDEILTERELCEKWPGTDEYLDLCFECIARSDPDFDPDLEEFYDDIEEY